MGGVCLSECAGSVCVLVCVQCSCVGCVELCVSVYLVLCVECVCECVWCVTTGVIAGGVCR